MTAAEKSWTIGYWEICLRTIKNAVIFQLLVIIVVVYDLVERYCLYTLFLNPWKEKNEHIYTEPETPDRAQGWLYVRLLSDICKLTAIMPRWLQLKE